MQLPSHPTESPCLFAGSSLSHGKSRNPSCFGLVLGFDALEVNWETADRIPRYICRPSAGATWSEPRGWTWDVGLGEGVSIWLCPIYGNTPPPPKTKQEKQKQDNGGVPLVSLRQQKQGTLKERHVYIYIYIYLYIGGSRPCPWVFSFRGSFHSTHQKLKISQGI